MTLVRFEKLPENVEFYDYMMAIYHKTKTEIACTMMLLYEEKYIPVNRQIWN